MPIRRFFSPLVLASLVASTSLVASELALTLEVAGKGVQEQYNQSRFVGASLIGSFTTDVTPYLQGHVRAKVRLDQGSSRSTFFDAYGPRQQLRLEEAALLWEPQETFRIRLGALNQDRLDVPSLIDSQTFVAAMEEADFGKYLTLRAQQALPSTPNGLLPTTGTDSTFPSFFWTQLTVHAEGALRPRLWVAHFAFLGLPAEVAHPGRFMGNSVSGGAAAFSTFDSRFEGLGLGGSLEWAEGWGSPSLSAYALFNPHASETGGAQVVRLTNTWVERPAWRLRSELSAFRVEADATPAFYNRQEWGHSNRFGFEAGLMAEMIKEKVSLGASFTHATPLRQTPFQDEFFYLQLLFQKTYDFL